MGGRPITCLNLVNFPDGQLPPEELHKIIEGALDKIIESGAVLAGGHTVEDSEPKFGLSVTGVVHPQKIWRNVGARHGDALILTKPIGSGVLFNAELKGKLNDATAFNSCIESVTTLNRTAAEILAKFEVHAATDITGFGLAGHALEMAQGSEAALTIELDALPVMAQAMEMYNAGVTTGVNRHNREKTIPHLSLEESAAQDRQEILFDPQTSGGLFVALPEEQAGDALEQLRESGLEHAAVVGRTSQRDNSIHLVIK
jgi:selenide,water dikinase